MCKMLPFDKRNAAQRSQSQQFMCRRRRRCHRCCSSCSCSCIHHRLQQQLLQGMRAVAVDVRSTMQICASCRSLSYLPATLTCNLLQLSNCLSVCVCKSLSLCVCVCASACCQTAFKHDSEKHSSPVTGSTAVLHCLSFSFNFSCDFDAEQITE